MAKDIILTVCYLLLFNFLIYRFKKLQFKSLKPVFTHLIFNLKFIVGIFIWIIYTFYYKDVQNNDVHKFYNDALVLRDYADVNPMGFTQIILGTTPADVAFETDNFKGELKNWERNFDEAPFNENRTIIKLNALLTFLSFRTYFVHILFMCFISLLGWVLLSNSIFTFIDKRNAILAIPVMLLPSVLFWTSGVMKEPLLVLGIGVFVSGIINIDRLPWRLNRNFNIAIMQTLMGALIMLSIKFFALVCIVPAAIAFLILRKSERPKLLYVKYLVVNILLLLFAFNICRIVPKYDLAQMLVNKQVHSIKEAEYFKAGSRIEMRPLETYAWDIIKASPCAIWNSMLRPYLWEGKNILMLASALENIFVIAFIGFCLYHFNWKRITELNTILFLLNASLMYFALIGIATPVLGNLVRYKAPFLPLLLYAFIINVKPQAISRKLNFVLRS